MSDTFSLEFYNTQTGNALVASITGDNQVTVVNSGAGQSSQLTNCTSLNVEKDYFVPSNGLTFVLETSTAITLYLQVGYQVRFGINGNPNMIGYIFDYDLKYSRDGGTILTIKCKDLLEYMAQGSIPPNITNSSTYNYHFNANTTFKQAITQVINAFQAVVGTPLIATIDGSDSLTAASGYRQGLPVKGKTPRTRSTSFTKQLNKFIVPYHGESYLAYILKIAKHAGCNVKMHNNSASQIIVKPPTYDWSTAPDLYLIHKIGDASINNNILEARMHFNFDKQPSVVIVDSNKTDLFNKSSIKGIAYNELTAYPITGATSTSNPIQSVLDYSNALLQGKNGIGYKLADFNSNLYASRQALGVNVNTNVCLPFYSVDHSANDPQSVLFAASKILAEAQDKYFEYNCTVNGWSTVTPNGETVIWQPDYCVTVVDDTISQNPFQLWIRKVNFTLTRDGGQHTNLMLQLPYTHNFEITQ